VTGRGARVGRGLGALAVLLLSLVGVPAALAVLGGNPLPTAITWESVREALFRRDDGSILLGLVVVLAWAAWLVYAISVLCELISLISRQRIRITLPGLAGPQRIAAGLLVSVAAMAAAPVIPLAPAPMAPTALAQPVDPEPQRPPPSVAPVPTAETGRAAIGRVHEVAPGDDLWTLAERYYGEGREWRRIAQANPDLLTGGPDRLKVGWRLLIPDDGTRPRAENQRTVTVRPGETLSSIAERELGSAERWRDIYRSNRALLADPDELPVGTVLVVPASQREERTERAEPTAETRPTDSAPERTPDPEPEPTPEPTPRSSPQPTPTVEPAPPTSPAAPADTDGKPVDDDSRDLVVPLLAVGSLLAAGLLEGLAFRRSVQLQTRPRGRRIPAPPPATLATAAALQRQQRPLSLRTLDRAMRAIAAHCRMTGTPPPPLRFALVSDDEIELVLAATVPEAPVGFRVDGKSWKLDPADADYLTSVPGAGDALRPWPALVTLGRDDRDRQVLADLEALRLLYLDPDPAFDAEGVLAAMAVELSFSPWADEMILTLVGPDERLPEALGKHNVTQTDDLDAVLDRLEQRAAVQREHQSYAVLSEHRIDPDLADPWAPEIVLVSQRLDGEQRTRLERLLDAEPQVTMAAVVVGSSDDDQRWRLTPDPSRPAARAVLTPGYRLVTLQRIDAPTRQGVVDLIRTSGIEETTPAPWWWDDADIQAKSPPDNVTFLEARSATWGRADTERGSAIMRVLSGTDGATAPSPYPVLQLLGPVNLVGATGPLPPRAAKQCLEYCAWLLEHPGTTAQAMGSALAVAEGTRRSNMSRLRTWLGSDPEGKPYLPDAYTGRIALHPAVSSDWHHLQILTTGGVNRASDDSLQAALELVRGAPLADTAPWQWHWAEELRTDMISCVRDIGAELTDRALTASDIDLARWAAARALVAAPGDELLLAARIRTEHLAGNPTETERLTLQLAAQARTLGVDLDPETVALLQRVMEGRVRARLA
jgi:LysM repeat protein